MSTKSEIETPEPVGSDALVLPLRVIDLDSPFLFGVGRDMTDEERVEAEKHGRYDNPPMSVLGVTHEGLAAVDGKELAQLFVSSPKMLSALKQLETGLMNEEENGLWDADYMLDQIIRPALREASGQNAIGEARADSATSPRNQTL